MLDPIESASEAGLKYVTDDQPGIRRLKKGKGFTYIDDGKGKVTCEKTLERIKSLVIPPAWKDVWICRQTNGHLQVTGRDARKRKQYRYHEKWNALRNITKFDRMVILSEKLPILKKQLDDDINLRGMPREKVIAAIIQLMLLTQTRIGNTTYAQENASYGLTTIRNDHAEVKGSKVHLTFRGKSGVEHDINFEDPKLAKIIKRCQELPGEELFAYQNENGDVIDINSSHVNNYLKSITGEDFTAKDLRTWGGTCKAIEILVQISPALGLSERKWKERHLSVIKATSKHLRNTVAVCRKYYIHPAVLEADRKGNLHKLWKSCRKCSEHHSREEKLLLKLLTQ
jgi:DNA topoisomerase-1